MQVSKSRSCLIFDIAASAIILLLIVATALLEIRADRPVQAASLESCLSSSGAPSVSSVQNACSACFTYGGSSRGTLWFNDGSTIDSDTVVVTADQAASGRVPIRLYGQTYSCSQASSGSSFAYYIWFSEADHMMTNDPPVNFISLSGTTLYRGTGIGRTYSWYSPKGNYMSGTLDIAGFKNGATCTDLGNGTSECIRVVSVNRCASAIGSYQNWDNQRNSTCYGDNATIKLVIPDEVIIEPADDGAFWSTSTIEVPAQNDVNYHKATSDSDGNGEVTMKLSTDADHLTVNFSHNLYYDQSLYDPNAYPTTSASLDTFPDVCTDWSVRYQEDWSGRVANGSLCTDQSSVNSGKEVSRTNDVRIDLDPGETVTVCQRIGYGPADVSLSRREHKHWVGVAPNSRYEHWYWEYHISGESGSGGSKSCIEVTRPEDPTGPGPDNGDSGSATGNVRFAGEAGTVGWSASAKSTGTRRYSAEQAIVYRVPGNIAYADWITSGDRRYAATSATDVCTFFTNFRHATDCTKLYNNTLNLSTDPTTTNFTHRDAVVIPDGVSDKYCNAFGYKVEYWFGLNYGGEDQWSKEARDYWYIYDSACRTIAKKPSAAIWNSSLMTVGGASTASSFRFDNAVMGKLASDGGAKTEYGSWSEYLAVVGGQVKGFASGSTRALGSATDNLLENSPLTISNADAINQNDDDKLGYSNIITNSAHLARLNTYLGEQAQSVGDTIGGGSDWTNLTATKIVRHSGTLNITGNITLAPGPYAPTTTINGQSSAIHSLPRVIIFADNINIASNVTRIDAWIIATDNINTCSDFVNQVTPAYAACSNQLTFNGPVLAKTLTLNRTHGSDVVAGQQKSTPAEIFNYRADDYLWAYAQAGRYDSSWTETYIRELPPRY